MPYLFAWRKVYVDDSNTVVESPEEEWDDDESWIGEGSRVLCDAGHLALAHWPSSAGCLLATSGGLYPALDNLVRSSPHSPEPGCVQRATRNTTQKPSTRMQA